MPIRPELRRFYGTEHRRYRAQLIAMFGARCTVCGREVEAYLNLAHTTHDPKAGQYAALMCASCHAVHDSAHRYAMTRRGRAKKVGQLWLFPEIEWAPYPGWMVPVKVLRETQGRLF